MKYQLSTCLQGDGWEVEGIYNSKNDAARKAVQMCHGPLGYSCMYQIVDETSKVVMDNPEIIKLAKKTPVKRCRCC